MTAIPNFRDIGGKDLGEGQTLKKNLLYRSGSLAELSEKDQSFLIKACDIKGIVDFRSDQEKQSEPDTNLPGVNYVPINILADTVEANGSLESMMTAKLSADAMMDSVYQNLVVTDSAKKGYHEFLALLLELKGQPLIFHCSAGKDRTGFAAALLLRLFGASMEDVFADYLLTNKQRAEVNQQMIAQISEAYKLSDDQLQQVKLMLQVQRSYLEKAFDTINQEFGDFETYVVKGLNFSKEEIAKLRSLYIISA